MIEIHKVKTDNIDYNNYIISPYSTFNETLNGGFKKGTSTMIAGISGSSISTFIANLMLKFVENINVKILSFCANDSPSKRKLRMALAATKSNISELKTEKVQQALKVIENYDIEFDDSFVNCSNIIQTASNYSDYNGYVVVIIEDIFSLIRMNEKNDFDLAQSVVDLVNALKRHNFIVICTNRFTAEIERQERIFNVAVHRPTRNDVYQGNILFTAFNNVYSFHQPRLLNIEYYGREKRDTKDLIHISKLKSSDSKRSEIWLTSVFKSGHYEEIDNNTINI